MKKIFTLFVAIVATCAIWAEDVVEINGIYYQLPGYYYDEYESGRNIYYGDSVLVVSKPDGKYEGDITIPSSVRYDDTDFRVAAIGYDAFRECFDLTSITLPNSIREIKGQAFNACRSLHTVVLNEGLLSIGGWAFYECQNLKNISLPNSLTYLGSNAFYMCKSLTSITIPTGLKEISDWAFQSCYGLQSIVIPNNIVSIGELAFSSCDSLRSITIGKNVTTIGDRAFSNCYKVVSIDVPSTVQNIGINAFVGILNVMYTGTAKDYDANNWGARYRNLYIEEDILYDSANKTSIKGTMYATHSSVVIPKSVKSIVYNAFNNFSGIKYVQWNAVNCTLEVTDYYFSDYAFFNNDIETFTFGNEVEVIPSSICYNMTNLTSITIPNSVTTIGANAFCNCSGVNTVTIGTGVKEIGEAAFGACTGLSTLTIPNNVTTINKSAFRKCSGLTSLNIGTGIKAIGASAFSNCNKLTSVTIPNSILEIGGSAFSSCTSLKTFSIKNPNAVCGNFVLASCAALETIEGPASLYNFAEEYMGDIDYVPYTASSITVTGGELEETGCLAITRNYKRLKTLDAGAATNTSLTDEAFMGCYVIEKLVLPSQLKSIPYMAVAGCKNLKSIDIPASVEEIAQSAFEDCRSIEEITFSGKKPTSPARLAEMASTSALKKIGNWAFYNAHELQHLELPEGLETVGDAAFYGCTYMKELELPSTVRKIGDNCFALCSKLEKITVKSTTPPAIAAKTFYDVERDIPVYVPQEVAEQYKEDEYWKEFNIQGVDMSTDEDKDDDEDKPVEDGLEEVTGDSWQVADGRKVMKDGQLLIIREGKVFNAMGVRL